MLSAVEVEFCFVMAKPLPPRDTPYTEDEARPPPFTNFHQRTDEFSFFNKTF